jgi:hypothetical protein
MRTVMWGDQFLADQMGGAPQFTARGTDLIPRDVLMFDWHYEPNHRYDKSLGYFREHGFEVVGCPWYEPVNVQAFAQAAARNGALGLCGTTWMGVRAAMDNTPHLPAAWAIGSEYAWNPARGALDTLPWQPVVEFNRARNLRTARDGPCFATVDLAPYCTRRLADSPQLDGWLGLGAEQDLSAVPAGVLWAGQTPFRVAAGADGRAACVMLADADTPAGALPEEMSGIAVGSEAKALYFMLTCSVPPGRNRQLYATQNPGALGEIVVNYADGGRETAPLRYLANIHDWNGQRGPAQAVDLWEGHTQGGALISLGAVRWENPRPAAVIESIDFRSALSTARPVLLGLTLAR